MDQSLRSHEADSSMLGGALCSMKSFIHLTIALILITIPLMSQQPSSCSSLINLGTSSSGVSFERQTQPEKEASFLRMARSFNNRMISALAQISLVHTQADADALEEKYRQHDELCIDEWFRITRLADNFGLLHGKKLPAEINHELDLQDALWKKLGTEMAKWSSKSKVQSNQN
jgi:hypothetical protein